ncbi:hypothetical protein OG689_41825 [Kitasatospora sp. NBC_00240]|uniref:hypothetical protein n=1 Tax=Kitasatospora sp. NBC_00240 TaxID=2903567 RepID=UPI00225008C6|nr:hypothetical protein [Kitasatospora sp. NBC_00240]MCX5215698.1 hypothetical protein [Kitasatospora sp. NBC_00240]
MFSNDPIVQSLVAMVRLQAERLREVKNSDRGGLSIEAAIIVGGLVVGAIALGVFLASKLTEKTGQIK